MNKPKDLVEAVKTLLSFDNIEDFKNSNPIEFHHGTGRWIRNNWGLWDKKSEIHKFFNSIGVYHADDMSGIILNTTHRILNKQPIKLEEQVGKYINYWLNHYSNINKINDMI